MNLVVNYDRLVFVLVNTNIDLNRDKFLLIDKKVKKTSEQIKKELGIPLLPIIDDEEVIKKEESVQDEKEEIIVEYNNDKLIAFTFDDGPSSYTEKLLEILKENESKATFFITGNVIRQNESIIKKIQDEGHQIGVHGFSHVSFTDLDIDEVDAEIAVTQDILYDIGVKPSNAVRPPFGKLNETIKEQIHSPFILWNIDTEDWKTRNKDKIKNRVLNNISEGSIILMHDAYPATIEAFKELIPTLKEKGYKLVTVDEMHKRYAVDLVPGRVYAKVKNN